ncbi:hypothetical protein PBY51_005324 [Eleginops maclovinus]|uniref:Interleukin-6 n=1 Tax=Eleginops maclovinus TaxID=56733 RepID=A0AAN7X028_ELEMC|nr:hypothetical protein PBY51_005324 [Eleginops maclovinus]
MSPKLNTYWLSAVMLCALLLCALGAPVGDSPTDSPEAGDTSGEEEVEPNDLLNNSEVWDLILGATKRHENEFENEFHNQVKYEFLDEYKISSLPERCPYTNFTKEDCLKRLVQGVQIYTVLLRHVEKEYPNSLICAEVKSNSGRLINVIKHKMKNPEQVTALTSSQEVQLLKDLDNPNTFHRKMTAHNILRQLHYFLLKGKRAIAKRERSRGSTAKEGLGIFQIL